MLENFYRALGDSDVRISPIGLGTVKLGRDKGVKYPSSFVIPNDQEASELIALASDLGINLIDTAPAYGTSEERLGTLLKGQRQKWVICSKAGEEFINGESVFDFSYDAVIRSVERSLNRLNTDYIDAVLIHSDGNDQHAIEQGSLDALNDLKKQGKILLSGISSKTVDGGIAALEKSDIAMVTYNLQQQDEKAVIDYANANNKSIFIKKAFASGHADDIQSSLKLVLETAGISSTIIGTITPAHVKKNVEIACEILNAS